MDAVDRGRARSVADQLRIQHGMKEGTVIASICKSLAGLCHEARTWKTGHPVYEENSVGCLSGGCAHEIESQSDFL